MAFLYFSTDLNSTSNVNNHLLQNPSSNNNNNNKKAPINIQIEVDIDPPPANQNAANQLSDEQLINLGLPAHHVHYSSSNNNKQLTSGHEELLAPSDIKVCLHLGKMPTHCLQFCLSSKVTYSEEPDDSGLKDRIGIFRSEAEKEVEAYDNYEAFNNAVYGTPEPPRALPSRGE